MHRVYLSAFFGAFNAIALPIRKKCDLEEFENEIFVVKSLYSILEINPLLNGFILAFMGLV